MATIPNWNLLTVIEKQELLAQAQNMDHFKNLTTTGNWTTRTTAEEEYRYKTNCARSAATRGQDNPLREIVTHLSEIYHRAARDVHTGRDVVRFAWDDYDLDRHQEICVGALEGHWREVNDIQQVFDMTMRDAGLDVMYRSRAIRCSDMGRVIAERLNKLFVGFPVFMRTVTKSNRDAGIWNTPSGVEFDHIRLEAAGYTVSAYDRDGEMEMLRGNHDLYRGLERSGFCMFFLEKDKMERLMIATHRRQGRIYKHVLRDKALSDLMLGDEWTDNERLMVEMAGYKDHLWLDSHEMRHIMSLPTLNIKEIEQCKITFQL